MLSVLILTRNEERDLPDCLASISWSDDIHVFDSFSNDRTCAIAHAAGAHVSRRRFDNYAAQRNAALHALPFKHPWVLILDADERLPPQAREELFDFAARASEEIAAARLRRRDFLYGKWLRHAQVSPYYVRVVRPHRVRYEREVNEVLKVDGRVLDLHQAFDHYPFSKGLKHWIDKHNTYSTMEAQLALKSRRGETDFSLRKAFSSADFNERRYHQKELFYRMPLRPLVRFLYMYVWRLGMLDGRAGFTYSMLQTMYEYLIVLKMRELSQAEEAKARAAAANAESAARVTSFTEGGKP